LISSVLDASAVLAFLREEPGQDVVEHHLEGAAISIINFSEVALVLARGGMPLAEVKRQLDNLLQNRIEYDEEQVWIATDIYQKTREFGLSFGDCACLALGSKLQVPVLTTESTWLKANLEITIELIRGNSS
jgi:ribonuclease VapC